MSSRGTLFAIERVFGCGAGPIEDTGVRWVARNSATLYDTPPSDPPRFLLWFCSLFSCCAYITLLLSNALTAPNFCAESNRTFAAVAKDDAPLLPLLPPTGGRGGGIWAGVHKTLCVCVCDKHTTV